MAYTDIDKPSDYFNTVLWTGNGSTQSITSLDFQPDFVWYKSRSNTYNHGLFDSIRGASKFLKSNSTDAESTISGVTAFNSDGFSVGSDAGSNGNGATFAAWNWKAGGTASSNSNGSITSSVSANTDAGFSIVSYTGTGANATVGHGLGVTPKWIIVKSRGVENWRVYSSYLGATKAMRLNGTDAADTDSSYWNGEPTSSVFTVGTNAGTNGSSVNMIAYCFAEKKGFSKFGSYTGNGSTDGTFIYTGFKPAWVMIKCTSTTESWDIKDNKRNPYNTCDNGLRANQNSSDDINTTYHMIDYLSNGFKLRGANQNLVNGSGQSYIYMAFAENPFVTSTGVPACAR